MSLEFTGEFLVPGQSPAHLEQDHLERYRFARGFADGRRVLDIACGAGYGSQMLAEAGAETVTGVDLNQDIIPPTTWTSPRAMSASSAKPAPSI